MPRKRKHEEHENLERWLISYADFITLLFAFFVVMYAISSVNEGKYRVLSDTLTAAFNNTPKTLQPIQIGSEGVTAEPSVLAPDELASQATSVIEPIQTSEMDQTLEQMADDFEQAVRPLIEQDLISVKRDDLWIEIEINTSLLFVSGSADLEDEAVPVLSRLGAVLRRYPNQIQVEGFTDNLPINNEIFPSNWELSGARAASVVRVFTQQGVAADRMAAIGYGETRPVAENDSAEGRRRNRRVVLVILADAASRRLLDIQRNTQPVSPRGAS